jgi:hypothetical protein
MSFGKDAFVDSEVGFRSEQPVHAQNASEPAQPVEDQ